MAEGARPCGTNKRGTCRCIIYIAALLPARVLRCCAVTARGKGQLRAVPSYLLDSNTISINLHVLKLILTLNNKLVIYKVLRKGRDSLS